MIQPDNALDRKDLSNGVIDIEITAVIVNKTFEFSFLFFTIPCGLLAVLLHMRVLMMLWKKEKTVVNQMMSIDCLMSMTFACLCTFQQSRTSGV